MREKGAKPDLRAARAAARQHGIVSTGQLLAAGLSEDGILRRVRAGRLHRLHRGVYAVGHSALSDEARWMAAVLACGDKAKRKPADRSGRRGGPTGRAGDEGRGPRQVSSEAILDRWGAALSHRSAAVLWALLPNRGGAVHVSVPGDGGRKTRKGIRVHRCRYLPPAAVTLHRGIPVTTPTRTIADLRRAGSASGRGGATSPKELRRAIRQAGVLGLPVGLEVEPDRTRSELEDRFLKLCRSHRLPPPEVNVRVGQMLVDFLWRDDRLIVETDGYRFHRGRAAFEDDRERDLRLRALGYQTIRFSYRQVANEPRRVAEVLGTALDRNASEIGERKGGVSGTAVRPGFRPDPDSEPP